MNHGSVSVTVNGRTVEREVPTRQTLAEFLRDELGLTGTKTSCAVQVCGVCTVLVDSEPVSACTYLAVDLDGREVLTIEGLSDGVELHPVQQAFVDSFALQCGFCTPGFVMMAVALLARKQDPSEAEIADYLEGNICRCTGYQPIVSAVRAAAANVNAGGVGS
jgi:aerobic-type carbon monoxide dehydrogenase small subunit (CoxS/CutS family)